MDTAIVTVSPDEAGVEFDYKGFMTDFRIADRFGVKAIYDTYNRAFSEWKDNVEYFTALVLTLNHQIWNWYKRDENIAKVYNSLWEQADGYGCQHFTGKEAEYYYKTLD